MAVYKRGGVWWYEFVFRGVRIRESTHSPNKEVAGRAERERRRDLELATAGLRRISGPVSISHAVKEFLNHRGPSWGPRTLDIHKNSWTHLQSHFGKLLLQDVAPRHISKYQAHRKKQGASGRTINIEIGLIRMVMVQHRLWHNIAPDVRMLREREDVGRALTPDEEHRVLTAAKNSLSRSLFPALLLSIHTGVRHQELRLLRWRQIDFLKEELRVGKSKTAGGEGRVVPLSETALAALREWRTQFPEAKPHHFVFPSERYGLHGTEGTFGGTIKVYEYDPETAIGGWKTSWTTCRGAAGVECRWHDMRHTFVQRLGENHVSDQTLMSMTGHLSRKMLERYSHARNESKRAAVRSLDPPASPAVSPQNPPQIEAKAKRAAT